MSCKGCAEKSYNFADALSKERMRKELVLKIKNLWGKLCVIKRIGCMICNKNIAIKVVPLLKGYYNIENAFCICADCNADCNAFLGDFEKKQQEFKRRLASPEVSPASPVIRIIDDYTFSELFDVEKAIRVKRF